MLRSKPTLTTRGRSGERRAVFRYGPAAAALIYPLALVLLHISGRHFVQESTTDGRVPAGLALCLAAALVGSVPALSFAVIVRSDRPTERLLAHIAFAAPPLFTMLGVAFFFLGVPNGDYVLWPIAWLGILAYAVRAAPDARVPARPANLVRTVHAVGAAVIIMGFLALHLANHLVAVRDIAAHKEVMLVLRGWYRSAFVQPVLVAFLLGQLLSGAWLLRANVGQAADVYRSIQTATAGYLLAYIPSHLIAVILLGRWFLGVDTDFAWASGAPSGLLLDAWNVRLIPHYSLAVLFVICHVAMGLRATLLGHSIRAVIANRAAWTLCAIGLVVSFMIAVAQLRV
jgi:hypothetical protein